MRDTSAGPRNCFPHQSRPSMSATESHLYQPHRSNAQVRDAALRWPVDSSNLTCRPETVRRPFPSFRIRRGRALVHARYAPIQHLPWRARGASTLVSIDRRSTTSMPMCGICIFATGSLISRALRKILITARFHTPPTRGVSTCTHQPPRISCTPPRHHWSTSNKPPCINSKSKTLLKDP